MRPWKPNLEFVTQSQEESPEWHDSISCNSRAPATPALSTPLPTGPTPTALPRGGSPKGVPIGRPCWHRLQFFDAVGKPTNARTPCDMPMMTPNRSWMQIVTSSQLENKMRGGPSIRIRQSPALHVARTTACALSSWRSRHVILPPWLMYNCIVSP